MGHVVIVDGEAHHLNAGEPGKDPGVRALVAKLNEQQKVTMCFTGTLSRESPPTDSGH